MNILIISFFNPIENAPRPAQLLGILDILDDKFNVDLITTKNKSSLKDSLKYKLYDLSKISIHEISDRGIFARFSSKIINYLRIDKGASFSFIALLKAIYLFKRFDRVICITNPFSSGFSGYILKKIKIAKKLHIDAGDPYSTHRRHQNEKFDSIRKNIEKLVCRNVDDFVVPLKDTLVDFPFLHKNYRVIPQIFSDKMAPYNYIFDCNVINILYAGRFYDNFRKPDYLFEALNKLLTEKVQIKFHFFGIEGLSKHQKNILEKFPLLKQQFVENKTIDREYLLDVMSRTDILVNIENDGLNQIPSKVIDYQLSKSLVYNISNSNKCNLKYNSKNEFESIYNGLKHIIKTQDYLCKTNYNLNDRISSYKNILRK